MKRSLLSLFTLTLMMACQSSFAKILFKGEHLCLSTAHNTHNPQQAYSELTGRARSHSDLYHNGNYKRLHKFEKLAVDECIYALRVCEKKKMALIRSASTQVERLKYTDSTCKVSKAVLLKLSKGLKEDKEVFSYTQLIGMDIDQILAQ